jgi:hypothetical protein
MNNNQNQSLKCPMCRQTVNCLLPLFTRNEIHSDDHNLIRNRIDEFNRKFINDPNVCFFYEMHQFIEISILNFLVNFKIL